MTIALNRERHRARWMLTLGALFCFAIPATVAIVLGRDKAFLILIGSSAIFSFILFGPPLTMALRGGASNKEWIDEGRGFARWMFRLGVPGLLAFNFFVVGFTSAWLDSPPGTPGYQSRRGEYVIFSRDGQIEAMTSGSRFNFTDHHLARVPASVSLAGLTGRGEGSTFYANFQVDTDIRTPAPVLVMPPNPEGLVAYYQRVGDQLPQDAVIAQVSEHLIRYLETLTPAERDQLRTLRLVWDVPINSALHGTGAHLRGSNTITLRVFTGLKAPAPVGPTPPADRTVRVSQIST